MSDSIVKIYASQDWVEEKLVQPDLSVNDETNPAYVKGRTHWVGDPVETVLVDTSVEFSDYSSPYTNPFLITLVLGEQYNVVWNDIKYECVAYEYNDYICIGNPWRINNDNEDNSMPFVIINSDGDTIVMTNKNGTHKVSISKEIRNVHKLPMMYLPDGYPYVGDPVETVIVDNLAKSQYEDGNYDGCTFVVGDTYNVVWNGTLYENLICVDDGEYRIIMSGDNYPAYIDDDGGNDLYISSNDEDADWTVSVSHIVPEIHHIDKEFLPPDMTIAWDNISDKPGGYYEKTDYAHLLHVDAEFSSDDTGMHDINEYAPKHLLTIGETYYPVIDGEELPAVVAKEYASQYQTYIVIGNPSLHNPLHENSGENYLLEVHPETGEVWGLFIKNAVTNGVKTFDLYGKGEVLVIIPDEFIPDTIARVSDIPTPIQPNWEQNDETAADYIKNRPFYTKYDDTELFNGIVTTIAEGDYADLCEIESDTTYKVTFNETEYICESIYSEDDDCYYIGSSTLWNNEPYNKSEPAFCYGDGWFVSTITGEHTIVISKISDEVETELFNGTVTISKSSCDVNLCEIEPDTTYKVTFDGYEYICESHSVQYFGYCIGSDSLPFGSYDESEPPFYYGNNGQFISTIAGEHNVVITKTIITEHKVDEKYLPYIVGKPGTGENSEVFNDYYDNVASGDYSHSEGSGTIASGDNSHAEGGYSEASGVNSHAEGWNTVASGNYSHTEGAGTYASSNYQHVQGKYNIKDESTDGNALNTYAHIVGNGSGYASSQRSNAHTLDWDGNAWFSGDVYVGSTSGKNKDEGSVKLARITDIPSIDGFATETYADSAVSTHNTSTDAHNDIRVLISDLSTKVNNFLDVDDTTSDQLSEVLAMIEANEGTIESLTSNKVNVSDIIDNLTTASANKVLSANQGVELKKLIDALQEAVSGKADEEHTHDYNELTNLPTIPSKTSELTNDSNYLSAIPDEYITETELNNKGYATQTNLDNHTTNNAIHVPAFTASDNGKFLRIVDGSTVWATIPNAEEATF